MKIVVSSTEKSLDSEIDVKFGRCKYFVFINIEDGKIKNTEITENPAQQQMGGAGISAAEFVANKGIEAIITGNIGPRAFTIFDQFKIEIYQATGKVKGAIEKFVENKLQKINAPTGPMLK